MRDKTLTTEPGAEGKPQILIPGIAAIGNRDRLQQLADRPMRGGDRPPPDGGLFDVDHRRQLDLLKDP